ncbi:MAG TPA: PxKF domain-containing protein [Pyrinomonadaceae bacterium]|nr:PxKF domain-containing protein [Pyrinomonadaceae bacterium]
MRPATHYYADYRHPDKTRSSSARTRAAFRPSGRAIVLALFAAIFTVLNTSASYAWPTGPRAAAYNAAALSAAPVAERDFASGLFLAAFFQLTTESVETYDSDCMTPKEQFTLGDTVCVKASVPLAILVGRRGINIIGPANVVRGSLGVSGLTQTFSFTLPSTAQTIIGDETFDNRGTWRADLSTLTSARRASVFFDVSAPTPAADLQIVAGIDGASTVNSGDPVTATVYVFNSGPDDAENVVVTPPTHSGLALQSFAPANGADCEGPCTIETLARRGFAKFVATYNVTAADGTKIAALTTVESDTEDPRPFSNADAIFLSVGVVNPNSFCALTCPADVVATANTTVGGDLGAFVKYSAAGVSGDCGAVTNSPAPDETTGLRFFPVGTHTITSTSETGGGSCTFSIKVVDTPAPTISCPADKFATDADDSGDETVAVGTPTHTASGGGTVTGLRSDSTPAVLDAEGEVITPAQPKPLTDPYPVGITSILWTVTDVDGRTATCTQKVIVTDNTCAGDTTPPTITAPDDVTVGTGSDNTGCTVALAGELGQPEVSDNCAVTVTITGLPPGNNFAPGTYTLTYKARDAAGNEATDTQVVTVIDDTAPIIQAPDDATYTCLSEVPAASPSQARGPAVGADGQFLRDANGELIFSASPFDNCGVTVTVSEAATGVGSATSPKVITRTFTAKDAANNTASDVQTITVADGTAPTLNVPADVTVYLPLNTPDVSMAVTYPAATATDNCSGTVTIAYTHPSGTVFNVGPTTVTVTATDAVGNQTTGTFTVTVLYNFTGFFSPVDNPPVLNQVKGGQTVPMKFSLSGNKGLGILAAGFPASQQVGCADNVPINDMEETETPGASTLTYTPDIYQYNWKTEKSWAGTCRVLTVKLNDGSTHTANFKFK